MYVYLSSLLQHHNCLTLSTKWFSIRFDSIEFPTTSNAEHLAQFQFS